MKHTSLFCAVALAAAMGTQAFADYTTYGATRVNEDFEHNLALPAFVTNVTADLNQQWTFVDGDLSQIVAGPVSATGSTEGAHLELNTEGNDLTVNAAAVTTAKSEITMKVRLVASDSEPSIADTSVHAAVYLYENENDPTATALYALAYDTDAGENIWTNIANAVTLPGLTNGCTVALKVTTDFAAGTKTVTYEGVMINAENLNAIVTNLAFAPLAVDVPMANPNEVEYNHLSSVSFRGTGGLDDLFVREVNDVDTTAHMIYEIIQSGEDPIIVDGPDDFDVEDNPYYGNVLPDLTSGYDPGTEVLSITLWERASGVDDAEVTLDTQPTINGRNFSFGLSNAVLEAGKTYVVKVEIGVPVVTYTVTFDANDASATGSMSDQTFTNNVAQNLKANGFALAGSTFAGWATSSAGEVVYADGASVTLSGANLTLYAKWTENAPVSAYVGPKSGHVQVLAAADEAAYESASGKEYVPLSFTSFSVNGSAVTAGLAGTFLVDSGESSEATFVLVTQTTLGGTEDKQTVTGTLTVTGENTATLTFTMPQGDTARFIKGLYVADPQN